ncbi:hypothetical protein [Streptomyces sp. NBC_00096]|uniref:hypothetical protein n=1 Tax=Streptomyces sp. NBC_00096 TaxID=2975650 RepID=UPI00324DD057
MGAGAAAVLMSTFVLQYANATPEDEPTGFDKSHFLLNDGFEEPRADSSTMKPGDWAVRTDKNKRHSVLSSPAWNPDVVGLREGHQFVQLYGGTMSRPIETKPGETLRWKIAHTGLRDATGSGFTLSMSDLDEEGARQEFTVVSQKDKWQVSEGEYKVPEGQERTLVQIQSNLSGNTLVDELAIDYVADVDSTVKAEGLLDVGKPHTVTTTVTNAGGGTLQNAILTAPVPDGFTADPASVVVRHTSGDKPEEPLELPKNHAWFDAGTLHIPLGKGASSPGGGLIEPEGAYSVSYDIKMADKLDAPSSMEFIHQPTLHSNQWLKEESTDLAAETIKIASADLSLVGDFSKKEPEKYVKGEEAKLSLKIENSGTSPAKDVQLKILRPEGLESFTTNDLACGEPDNADWITCTVGELKEHTDLAVTFAGTVGSTSGPLRSTAEVTTSTIDVTEGNDRNSFSSGITNVLDLKVETDVLRADDDRTPVGEGKAAPKEDVLLSVKVTNAGPARPDSVTVAVPLPQGAVLDTEKVEGQYKDGLWTIEDGLDAGASATLILPVSVPADDETLELGAYIESFGGLHDANLKNNDASRRVDVQLKSDVHLAVSAERGDESPYLPGEKATYTIRVDNRGPSAGRYVEISHVLPEGMTQIRARGGPAGTTYEDGVWTIPKLDVGTDKAAVLTVEGIVPADREAGVHRVCVTGGETVPKDSIDTKCDDYQGAPEHVAQHVLPVRQQGAVSVKVTAGKPQALPGQEVTWTVEAVNDGPSTVRGLEIETSLPEGVTLESVGEKNGSFDEKSGLWKPGDLGSDQGTAVIKLTGKVPADRDTLTARATVKQSGTPLQGQDTVIGVPRSHVLKVVQQADLDVAVAAGEETVKAGEKGTISVTVKNAGPSTAVDTAVELALPSGADGVTHDGGDAFDPQTGTWKAGSLPKDGSKTLTVGFTTDKPQDYRLDVLALDSKADDPNECVEICGSAAVTATSDGKSAPGGSDGGSDSSDGAGDSDTAGTAGGASEDDGEGESILDQALAATGSSALWWALGTIGTLGIGAALLIAARRRA